MGQLNKDKLADGIYHALLNGKNSYLRMSHVESSHFDPSWIKVIEDCLFDLGEIIGAPRSMSMRESAVVPIELAKKIDGDSVRHLASHSEYIKEIDEKGNVVPSKILSHNNEDNIHTYENRFIATFIRRLVLFIEKRYQFVHDNISLYSDDVLIMKNNTEVNGQIVEIETRVRVRKESDDDVAIESRGYIERILKMREYITYYYNSPFMKQMKNERDVRKPILQTNIIRKNPQYRKCFETFTFIERFDSLGVTYKVNEDYSSFNEAEKKQFNYLLLSQYLALQDTKSFDSVKTNNKVYKPRVLTSLDDEKFVYGPIYKGPIEFVRIDSEYRKYLQDRARQDLPARPNKYEKEFYKEEYDYKKKIKEEQKQIDKLLARKYKDLKEFEKAVGKILAKRQEEEIAAENERLKRLREEEDRRIEAKRQEIIAAAKQRKEEMRAQQKAEEAKRLEEERLRKEKEEQGRLEQERLAEEERRRQEEEQRRLEEEARLKAEEEARLAEEQARLEEEARLAEQVRLEEEARQAEEAKQEEPPVEEEVPEQPAKETPVPEEESVNDVVAPEEPVEEPKPEEPIEEAPEQPAEEAPAEEPVQEESAPEPEPEPEPEPVPVVEEPQEEKVEEPVEEVKPEEPVKEEPVKEKKPRKAKAKKPAPVVKEEPVNKEPEKEEKPRKKPVKEKKEDESWEKIPGKFIVKAYEGYYINDKKFSVYKRDAKLFDDFVEAKRIKAKFGGKVIKL